MRDFRKVEVWHKAHNFCLSIYKLLSDFPEKERFGLTSQMRRAAVSVPTNIAEGCGRSGNKEMANFLNIAAGSSSELQYQLILAKDLGYISSEHWTIHDKAIAEIRRMLYGFIRNLKEAPET